MSFRTLAAVSFAHLLILCLVAGTRPWSSAPGTQTPPEPSSPEDTGTPETGDSPEPGASTPLPVFSDSLFRQDIRPLSESLKQKTSSCKTGVLVDWTSRTIRWEKDGKKVVPIASLTKMATALLLVEAVQADPDLSLDTRYNVTEAASKIGGSQVWLDPREVLSLDTVLECMMIHSANDAAFFAAQILGKGDVNAFVRKMNERTHDLGLRTMHFANPHGLSEPNSADDNRANAVELAYLAARLLEFPEVVKWSSTWTTYIRQDTPKPFQLVNRNRLVVDVPGVNGMKTGYTNRSGYCVAATCEREGRVFVAVVTGCPTSDQRNALVAELLEWGYGG